MRFGAYAQAQGATRYEELPVHVDGFVEHWLHRRDDRRAMGPPRPKLALEVRGPIEQMLRLIVPGFVGHTRRRHAGLPFAASVPGFFGYLREERGLREETLAHYAHHLRRLETYLSDIGLTDLGELSVVVTSGFLTDRSQGLQRTGVRDRCGVLRVFLRYLHREGVLARDLSPTVEAAPVYRLAHIPRSITWGEVQRMLEDALTRLTALHPESFRAFIGFDNALAHRIYAGGDMLLMPSLYEPCGLNQMYALRYGTLPIVRLTGGLADTVVPFDGTNPDVANGFGFAAALPVELYLATWVSMLNYKNAPLWNTLQMNGMRCDFSWDRSALEYDRIYRRAMGN